MSNIKMTTKVDRLKLIATLKDNLKRHSSIVQEAREGYVKKARESLEKRLEQIRRGEVVELRFSLVPPQDYTETYVNSIEMLEWNLSETVELQPQEFRQLVRDQWDWTNNFLSANARYSGQAQDWLNESLGGSLVAVPEDE